MADEIEIIGETGNLRRREFIAGAAAGARRGGPAQLRGNCPRAKAAARERQVRARRGVRLPGPEGDHALDARLRAHRSSRLTLEVATDKHFRQVVKRQEVIADANDDYTVHARVAGLKPAHEYYYRFHTKHKNSRVGRFRTLPPADSNQTLRIGFYSCQSYEAGYFTAQAALAKEKDLDLVLCLGDYIYEHHYYDGPAAAPTRPARTRTATCRRLAEYREKYRFYQSDPNLQDLHAAYPFVVDLGRPRGRGQLRRHEAGLGVDRSRTRRTTATRAGCRSARRKNGYKAFFEAMPRRPEGDDPNRIYGSMRLGRWPSCSSPTSASTATRSRADDVQVTDCPDDRAGRTFLGAKQKSWLKGAVPKSKAKWNLLASETMMMGARRAPRPAREPGPGGTATRPSARRSSRTSTTKGSTTWSC